MPTASVGRLEKQASFDSCEPLRQGITMIEHKIRNLEKRKARLDSCRDLQKSGKDLNSDQLEAISKYDAVIQHLDFARELSKQLTALANDTAKTLKKQARKEAAEKAQQDIGKMKEVLMIQDVLANMGTESVREDFLQGKNNVKLTSEELQSIDDLFIGLTPKKDEPQVFTDMFQTPAETMMALIEGKNKEAFGTTYSALKTKLIEISKSGYFDTTPPPPPPEVVAPPPVESEPVQEFVQPEKLPEMMKMEDIERTQIASAQNMAYSQTTAKPSIPPPHVIPPEQYSYAHPPQPEVMTNAQTLEAAYFNPHLRVFKSGTIDFMQENEIDVPETGEQQPSAIPSMTYTNQNYGSPMEHHPPPPPVEPQPYQNQTDEEKGWSTVPTNSIEPEQTNSTPNAWGASPSIVMDQPQNNTNSVGASGDDWASQTDHWQQSQQNNDGFITAGGTRGRGSRGRSGGGGDRNKGFQKGGRGGSSTGRGGYRGEKGDGYRDRDNRDGYNRDGGFNRNDGYKDQNSGGYQNGYSGGRGGGNRNRNNQSDRPGGRGGNRGRGSGGGYRGGNQSGNYRQPVQ